MSTPFQEFRLSDSLLRAIEELGFTEPSPIQAQALPILLGPPTDFVGLAATGTGKTAAFGLPLLERIDPRNRNTQAIILCPTRELALQVTGQLDLFGKHLGVSTLAIYGGAGYGDQLNGLRRGAQIVIGTPGRVIDHLSRGTLRLDQVKTLVLDEADEMISMGFKDDLEAVLSQLPEEKANTWLFSATMSSEVRRVANTYLKAPVQVTVNREQIVPRNVEQLYFVTSERNKPDVLRKLIDAAPEFYGIVFCQTKALVVDLTRDLTEKGYCVDCLHGDMDQRAREKAMNAFRDRKVNVLVCTDVASRGLDVKDLTHVINYSIPRELDHYIHRIGRTARSGKSGLALSLVAPTGRGMICRIEQATRSKIREGKIPSRREIGEKKISALRDRFESETAHARAIELLDADWRTLLASMTPEEVAGRMLALQYPELFAPEPRQPSFSARTTLACRPDRKYPRPERRDFGSEERRPTPRDFSSRRMPSKAPHFASHKKKRTPELQNVPPRRTQVKRRVDQTGM